MQTQVTELHNQLESMQSSGLTIQQMAAPRELVRDEVQVLWDASDRAAYPRDIQDHTCDSLMRGLFKRGAEHTKLHTRCGRRPYVCPFRGPRYAYATPESLVNNAIPWILEQTQRTANSKITIRALHTAEREAHKNRFATQSTAQLTALYDKMQHDLESENLTNWTVDHKTLVMYRDIIAEILEERKPNH